MGRSVDEDFKLTVVSSLPKSWDHWTTAYLGGEENSGGKPRMNSQQLISIICDEAERQNLDEAEKTKKSNK
jgi:hypothetical protein